MYNFDDRSLGRTACSRCNSDAVTTNSPAAAEGVAEQYADYGCGENSESVWGLRGYPLAQVYSPLQNFTEIYDCENALIRGTVFAQLDLPFVCGGMTGGVSRG